MTSRARFAAYPEGPSQRLLRSRVRRPARSACCAAWACTGLTSGNASLAALGVAPRRTAAARGAGWTVCSALLPSSPWATGRWCCATTTRSPHLLTSGHSSSNGGTVVAYRAGRGAGGRVCSGSLTGCCRQKLIGWPPAWIAWSALIVETPAHRLGTTRSPSSRSQDEIRRNTGLCPAGTQEPPLVRQRASERQAGSNSILVDGEDVARTHRCTRTCIFAIRASARADGPGIQWAAHRPR